MITHIKKQRGAALIVSLVILLLMTLIGIFAMRSSVMEEKMATNQRDRELARQAAEIALRDAENALASLTSEPVATANGSDNDIRTYNAPDPDTSNANPWWMERDAAWWTANGVAATLPANVGAAPRYIIEQLEFDTDSELEGTGEQSNGKFYYRITARGTGGSALARVLLQTTVVKEY
jgi:type IV pilus assembly protein PilX